MFGRRMISFIGEQLLPVDDVLAKLFGVKLNTSLLTAEIQRTQEHIQTLESVKNQTLQHEDELRHLIVYSEEELRAQESKRAHMKQVWETKLQQLPQTLLALLVDGIQQLIAALGLWPEQKKILQEIQKLDSEIAGGELQIKSTREKMESLASEYDHIHTKHDQLKKEICQHNDQLHSLRNMLLVEGGLRGELLAAIDEDETTAAYDNYMQNFRSQ